jgi:hypothetical protein
MRGKSWRVDGGFLETKNVPLALTIFSIFSTETTKPALLGGFFWFVNRG